MKNLRGKVAVVTGGASGIGEGLVRACAAEGMKVVVADVVGDDAETIAKELAAGGAQAISVTVDVRDPDALQALADRTYDEFGACHLLHNNAGVALFRQAVDMQVKDWQWVLEVNLMGVLYGLAAFLPRMKTQGEGHIVNTASIAGLNPMGKNLTSYVASKYAVVGLSASLRNEVEELGLGVSVLCPGGVATRIGESERVRPADRETIPGKTMAELGESGAPTGATPDQSVDGYSTPDELAQLILRAVREDELYIIPHPSWRPLVSEYHDEILAAFDAAAARRPK